ncbi:kelch-like protein 12 [Amborella trichopoda]|nr:kelch-like protein 12 [Amborella trichopoda]XP_020530568.1 kelch-like protein 12 [Amborella trichopoda]XP_020530574.1 kelch-like protein 12 [Amborella trichopoda]|eukprot:XP_011627559.1 kelch-like protein 12 [Amborella trichopoda]
MGAGRKTQTLYCSERTDKSSSSTVRNNTAARNLKKDDLGGVIFGCKNSTITECLSKQLFGLPAPHFSYVKNIMPGLPLFLFNYSDRKLHGIFEAASMGHMNINPYGWTNDGSERTQFPAQVRVCVRQHCQPLAEQQFKSLISENYYTNAYFWFELDHAQVDRLIALFSVNPNFRSLETDFPRGAPPKSSWLDSLTLPTYELPIDSSYSVFSADYNIESSGSKGGSYAVDCGKANKILHHNGSEDIEWCCSSKTSSSIHEEEDSKQSALDGVTSPKTDVEERGVIVDGAKSPKIDLEGGEFVPDGDISTKIDLEEDDTLSSVEGTVMDEEYVLEKIKKLAIDRESSKSPIQVHDNGIVEQEDDKWLATSKTEHQKAAEGTRTYQTNIYLYIDQLKVDVHSLKNALSEQNQQTKLLEQKQRESDKVIQELREHIRKLESEVLTVSDSNIEELVFLVGGHDGVSWLQRLDAYFPHKDVLKSLKPMHSVRSYASAASLNGSLYVFGGGNGSSWYDTVESYNPSNDEWSVCPSMTHKKGSLGAATLQSKIFAVGGGDGVQSFSDVEIYDPILGKWVVIGSMLEKRFATAAAVLNGSLYAVGGFNGNEYLKSAERFDPREVSWNRIPSMTFKRGSHSIAVLNDKIYAIGGYDGHSFVSYVEIFDPRADAWMMGELMTGPRGYATASVLGDAIFVIGGLVRERLQMTDTVECYREGAGWTNFVSKAIGRRCFQSAVIL